MVERVSEQLRPIDFKDVIGIIEAYDATREPVYVSEIDADMMRQYESAFHIRIVARPEIPSGKIFMMAPPAPSGTMDA
jgi:hypothetical protein